MASEKNNYNFRRANFAAMLTELDYQTVEQRIARNNPELGFEILKNRVNDASRRHIPRRQATINSLSRMNSDVEHAIGRRHSAYEGSFFINEETVAEYIEAKRQVKRIVKQEKRNKE